ncbi:MAG: hypothetical protein Rubg2KO_40970 [Rubricoccaceae bacterium]
MDPMTICSVAEIHDLFRAGLSQPARMQLVSCAAQAHASAKQLMRGWSTSRDLARDVFPHLFRLDFQTRLATLALPGVHVRIEQNANGTSAFAEVRTETVRVTSLTRAREPLQLPVAHYRETRARDSQTTFNFFDEPPAPPPADGTELFGVYVYGGGHREFKLAKLYFPVPGLPLRAIPPLDLLLEYQRVVGSGAAAETVRPTEAASEVMLNLKKRVKTNAEE